MKSFAVLAALTALGVVSANPTKTDVQQPNKRATLPAVSASGNAFWTGSTRFYIRGIDYQPGGASNTSDPLADSTICKRDIAEFKKLGVNTVRVYITDNSRSHDECMNLLDAAGIYLVVDVNNPLYSINRDNPSPSYNAKYLQSVFATVDAFAKYPNTLAFFSGNEVINDQPGTTKTAPYVKAVTRDIKNYIASRGLRKIPVGYSAADVSQNRMQTAQYMNCGTDDARSDFFAFNDYSWCNTDFKTAGWDQKVKNFTDYGLPIFLSEWGCKTNGRDFNELSALMSSQMSGVYSGGLMYEYTLEENGFGIVKVASSGGISEQPEFAKFAAALSKYPAPAGSGGAAQTTHSVACPTQDSIWEVNPTLIPVFPKDADQYMKSGAGAGPGLTGAGSQNSGPADPSLTTGGSPSPTKNAAAGINAPGALDKTPLILTVFVAAFTLLGAMAL